MAMQRRLNPRKSRRRGAAAVELALLAPLLASLFVMALDYARIFYFSMIVTNCARSGAIYGSKSPTYANDSSGISTAAKMDASNLTAASLTVTSSTDSTTNPTYVTVTVTYPFSTITNFPGISGTTTLTRSVKVTVTPLTPS